MKVGLDTYSFRFAGGLWVEGDWEPLSPFDFLAVASELGLHGVHFCDLRHFGDPPDEGVVRKVVQEAERRGLYIELGTGGADVEHLRKALDLCVMVNSEVLRTFVEGVGMRQRMSPEEWRRHLESCVGPLKEVAKYAESKGVRIALENHGSARAEDILWLIDSVGSDFVGACLDTGNPFFVLEDPLEAAEKLAPHTFTVHLKEYRPLLSPRGLVVEGCPLFDGSVPNEEMVEVLRQRSPKGDELCLNLEVPLERILVPLFDHAFLRNLGDPSATQIVKALRYVKGWTEEVADFHPSPEILTQERGQISVSAERALGKWA